MWRTSLKRNHSHSNGDLRTGSKNGGKRLNVTPAIAKQRFIVREGGVSGYGGRVRKGSIKERIFFRPAQWDCSWMGAGEIIHEGGQSPVAGSLDKLI